MLGQTTELLDLLATRLGRVDFARLVAALVRVELAGEHDTVLRAARVGRIDG